MSDTEETKSAPNAQDDPIAYNTIRFHTIEAHENYKKYLALLMEACKDRHATISDLKAIKQGLVNYAEKAVDWAAKLLPYEMPKLESVELKAQTEHKFVFTVPTKLKSVDEWAQAVGATYKDLENTAINATRNQISAPAVTSVHDHDGDDDNDELETQKRLKAAH